MSTPAARIAGRRLDELRSLLHHAPPDQTDSRLLERIDLDDRSNLLLVWHRFSFVLGQRNEGKGILGMLVRGEASLVSLSEIIHGLLMEEADCRDVTRSVSFEVALLRFNPEGSKRLAGGRRQAHHRIVEKTDLTSRRDVSRSCWHPSGMCDLLSRQSGGAPVGDHRLIAWNPPG